MQFTNNARAPRQHRFEPQALWRRSCGRLARVSVALLADFVRGPATPAEVSAAPALPRYRHPERGFTWDGRGMQPQWLRDAVLREGYLLLQLRCPDAVPLS